MQKKNFTIALIIFTLGILGFSLCFWWINQAQAGTEHNVWGWAFAENVGWFSFNSINTASPINYGVNIGVDGIFSGYAWSRGTVADPGGFGWLTFNPAELDGCGVPPCCPVPPCQARIDLATGNISGWARACTVFQVGCTGALKPNDERGGWEGWIRLRDASYGLNINLAAASPREFTGWAWGGGPNASSSVIGWLSFNSDNCDVDGDGTYEGAGESGGPAPVGCPTSGTVWDYKVQTSFSVPPNAENLTVTKRDYCSLPAAHKFEWDFVDQTPGDSQSKFQLQIDKDGDFSNIEAGSPLAGEADIVLLTGANTTFVDVIQNPVFNDLAYNTQYWWRLRVWDSGNTTSTGWLGTSWIYPPSNTGSPTAPPGQWFRTELHQYPQPDFLYIPSSPTVDEFIQFCSVQEGVCAGGNPALMSECYDINNTLIPCTTNGDFQWTFPADVEFATGSSPTSTNPQAKFTVQGPKTVSLNITDNSLPPAGAVSCTTTDSNIMVAIPLPEWKEISP